MEVGRVHPRPEDPKKLMSHPEDLVQACQSRLSKEGIGDEVIAAGAFALQDNYKATAAGGVASAFLPGSSKPGIGAVENVAGMEAARQANAAAHGVTERMMVCVTGPEIYVFGLRTMGNDPGEILARFDRADADVEVKRFGLSKRLRISEGDQELHLQGSTARVSPDSRGDKAVLSALG